LEYEVVVDWAPAYELVTSFQAYARPLHNKALEVGADWIKRVRPLLPDWFDQEVKAIPEKIAFPHVLLTRCPGARDTAALAGWLGAQSGPELYDLVCELTGEEGTPPASVLADVRDRYQRLLTAWDECYFRTLDLRIVEGLEAEATTWQHRATELNPVDLVAAATRGLRFEGPPDLKRVTLVPQYHFRPINLITWLPNHCLVLFGVDPVAPPPGEVPAQLQRLIRALDDRSRLQILRAIGQAPRSFTEVVELAGLAKSTVHHHLVTLRAAGLVWYHITSIETDRYSLRTDALEHLVPDLTTFLKGE
jgi:hypothetical protein